MFSRSINNLHFSPSLLLAQLFLFNVCLFVCLFCFCSVGSIQQRVSNMRQVCFARVNLLLCFSVILYHSRKVVWFHCSTHPNCTRGSIKVSKVTLSLLWSNQTFCYWLNMLIVGTPKRNSMLNSFQWLMCVIIISLQPGVNSIGVNYNGVIMPYGLIRVYDKWYSIIQYNKRVAMFNN